MPEHRKSTTHSGFQPLVIAGLPAELVADLQTQCTDVVVDDFGLVGAKEQNIPFCAPVRSRMSAMAASMFSPGFAGRPNLADKLTLIQAKPWQRRS
jgi:hypothetical protein